MSILSWLWGAPAPSFQEDTSKFLEFFPTTCPDCRPKSDALFKCLSDSTAASLKAEDLAVRAAASVKMREDCEKELRMYNECMLTYFQKKKADSKIKAFRVSFMKIQHFRPSQC